jgi:hypothetical protein
MILDGDFSVGERYIALLQSNTDAYVEDHDVIVLGYIGSNAVRDGKLALMQALDPLASLIKSTSAPTGFGYSFFNYVDMLRLETLGRIEDAVSSATTLLKIFAANKPKYNSEAMVTIERSARDLIARHQPKNVLVNQYKSIGRNTKVAVIYKDGRRVENRFKAVQRDLVLGNCRLAEDISADSDS